MAELDDILGSLFGTESSEKENSGEEDIMGILLKVMPLINTVNKENDDERLLNALVPYMSDTRKEKIDTARSILKIAKILPLLGQVLGGE